MESMFESMAGKLHQPDSIAQEGFNLYRQLEAKKLGLGLSSIYQTAVCIHLAVEGRGNSLDIRTMVKLAGAKSKSQFQDTLHNVRSILGLNQTLTLQEIGIQLSAAALVNEAKVVLDVYSAHLRSVYGEERAANINLSKELYLCSAFYAAGKRTKTKLDLSKVVEIGKAKKKDIVELGEQMLSLVPVKPAAGATKPRDFNDSYLATLQEEENPETQTKKRLGEETELEDFQVWKERILERAVAAGFTKYKKYLTSNSA